jgi:uncharacterized protein YcfJ
MGRPMPPVRARLAALVVPLAAIVAGCGTAATPAHQGRLDVTLHEFRLSPAHAQARAGRLAIAARNGGTLVHQLAIGRGRYALAVTPALRPGQSAVLRVRLPAGSYRLFDPRADYDTLGLYGSLVVR